MGCCRSGDRAWRALPPGQASGGEGGLTVSASGRCHFEVNGPRSRHDAGGLKGERGKGRRVRRAGCLSDMPSEDYFSML